MNPIITATVQIVESKVHRITAKVELLNRHAKRLGVDPIDLRISFARTEYQRRGLNGEMFWSTSALDPITGGIDLFPVTRNLFDVTVSGTAPALAGWRVIAVCDFTPDGTPVVRTLPGPDGQHPEIPAEFACGSRCDHCNTARPRKQTYVLVSEAGRMVTVGSACLQDFCPGMRNPANVLHIWEVAKRELDEERNSFDSGDLYLGTDATLAMAVSVINKHGYVKAGDDGRHMPTAHFVHNLLTSKLMTAEDRAPYLPTAEDIETARTIREFYRNADAKPGYESTLKSVMGCDGLNPKHINIAVSAVPAYRRQMEERAKLDDNLTRHYARKKAGTLTTVGQVGDKIMGTFTISGTATFPTDFGVTAVNHLIDQEGNHLIWFSSSAIELGARGESVTIKGTIKAHDRDRREGHPVTMLTRVKAV